METINWKYAIGEQIVDYREDGTIRRNLTIIDKELLIKKRTPDKATGKIYDRKEKRYRYQCNVCGWNNGWAIENNLSSHKKGCSCCAGKTIVHGINDIATTHPHLVKYFKNHNDAFLYAAHANCCVELVCPDCGSVRNDYSIDLLSRSGFRCKECADGISYPEKFINAFLKQLNVEYKLQLNRTTYDWCRGYRYDFWFKFNDEEYLVEVHGSQHYYEQKNLARNLSDIQQNDYAKKELALLNGFDDNHYIVLNCSESRLNWIKNEIEHSYFATLIDLTTINWIKCHEFACSSLIKEVCEYWQSHHTSPISTREVAEHFQLSMPTVRSYLYYGNKLNLCEYDANISKRIKKRFNKSKIKTTKKGD